MAEGIPSVHPSVRMPDFQFLFEWIGDWWCYEYFFSVDYNFSS